ncbi:Rap1a/Tai family immunity protein [Terrihabitans rhizophilus]|uniref:Rap1a/Tai family immunity protein n=1 Tax=Terrihabitans rhizophilus TaxID=3092662 RepID=A0ABU4RN97_9HYPH|nr:Rap1a/Tai family immunity protein [Terrihabitans sp. PJ23]MDX6806303.1 Rap1a/Tai family immunity protein [Terrihabitans sp. PJ23]
MLHKLAYAALLLTGLGTGAKAEFFSGNDLMAGCQVRSAAVSSYVLGVVDAAELHAVAGGSSIKICAPPGATGEQLRDVFCKALLAKPEDRHRPAAALASLALDEAFPCKD